MKRTLNINKLILLSLTLAFSSCGQTFNSNTNDTGLVALGACTEAGTPAGDRYCAAEKVIQDRCVNCHSGYHDQWAKWKDETAWKSSGRVVAGSTASSVLITRLKNQGGNMPADAPQIADTEYQTLIDWVQMMTP